MNERGETFLDICNRFFTSAVIVHGADQGGVLALLKKIGVSAFGIGGD